MDSDVVGVTGTITVATRGDGGLGEVMLRMRGGTEIYLARSDEPLGRGTAVLVVEALGARTVIVAPLAAPLR